VTTRSEPRWTAEEEWVVFTVSDTASDDARAARTLFEPSCRPMRPTMRQVRRNGAGARDQPEVLPADGRRHPGRDDPRKRLGLHGPASRRGRERGREASAVRPSPFRPFLVGRPEGALRFRDPAQAPARDRRRPCGACDLMVRLCGSRGVPGPDGAEGRRGLRLARSSRPTSSSSTRSCRGETVGTSSAELKSTPTSRRIPVVVVTTISDERERAPRAPEPQSSSVEAGRRDRLVSFLRACRKGLPPGRAHDGDAEDARGDEGPGEPLASARVPDVRGGGLRDRAGAGEMEIFALKRGRRRGVNNVVVHGYRGLPPGEWPSSSRRTRSGSP